MLAIGDASFVAGLKAVYIKGLWAKETKKTKKTWSKETVWHQKRS